MMTTISVIQDPIDGQVLTIHGTTSDNPTSGQLMVPAATVNPNGAVDQTAVLVLGTGTFSVSITLPAGNYDPGVLTFTTAAGPVQPQGGTAAVSILGIAGNPEAAGGNTPPPPTITNERLDMAKRDATQFINHIPIGQSGQRLLTTLVDSLIDDIKQLRDAQTIMAAKLDADAGVTDTNYSAVATVPDADVILGK